MAGTIFELRWHRPAPRRRPRQHAFADGGDRSLCGQTTRSTSNFLPPGFARNYVCEHCLRIMSTMIKDELSR